MAERKIEAAEILSDDELDGVAGGTWKENMELYNMMAKIDPSGTAKLVSEWQQLDRQTQGNFTSRLSGLINDYLQGMGMKNVSCRLGNKADNEYIIGDKRVSHEEFLDYLNGGSF